MSGHVLIGCRGWNHNEWTPDFYPEDLPDDWRFCFYSNEIRSVLVPFGDIYDADPRQWREDCDDAFRFVFEYPIDDVTKADNADNLLQMVRHIQPVVERTAAILISVSDDVEYSVSGVRRLLEAVPDLPLCVDLSGMKNMDEWLKSLEQSEVGRVWHSPCVPSSPVNGFHISLVEDAELPTLREIFESLSMHAQCGAAVFFTNTDKAMSLTRQARTMAEIMGI